MYSMLAAGVYSLHKWDVLVPFLTEKEQVSSVFSAFNSRCPILLAAVFEELLRMVFFLLYMLNLLAALSTWVSEVLMCPVVHAEVWCWVLDAVVSCSWRRFLVNLGGGGCALSEDSSALDHSFLLLLLWKQKPFLCMHACLLLRNPSQPFSGSPMTSFKLLSANILILTSRHPFPFISLCVFPLTLSQSPPRFLDSAGMSPQLQSTNQFPSESVTSYFICSLPISSAPPPIFTQFDINLTYIIFPCIPGPFFFPAKASSDNCTFKSD